MRKILALVTSIESNILSMTQKSRVGIELWPLIRPALNTLVVLRCVILFLLIAHGEE